MDGMEGEFCVVLITAGAVEEARRLADTLVDAQLAACVNVLPGVTSVYRWEGAVQCDSEVLLVVKTRRTLLERLVEAVRALHSYDVPEVIALPIVGGSPSYLQWLADSVPA